MGAIACVLSVAAGGRGLLDPTPGQTPGPFYPHELPLDDDSDLTQVAGRDGRALGKIVDLDGRLLDMNGEPVRMRGSRSGSAMRTGVITIRGTEGPMHPIHASKVTATV